MKGIYVHTCVCMYMHKYTHMCIQRTQIRLFLVNWDLDIFYGLSSVVISLKCVLLYWLALFFNFKKPWQTDAIKKSDFSCLFSP